MRFPVALLAMVLALPAQAATLGTFTKSYTESDGAGSGRPMVQPPDAVGIPVFVDSFDISSLAGATISELVLSITFGTQLSVYPGGPGWFMDIYGSDNTSQADDLTLALGAPDVLGQTTATLTANSLSGDAFLTSVSNLRVDFGFRDESGGLLDFMRIHDATLTVNGSAVVPLPAPLLLLLTALGGVALSRRGARRSNAGTFRASGQAGEPSVPPCPGWAGPETQPRWQTACPQCLCT